MDDLKKKYALFVLGDLMKIATTRDERELMDSYNYVTSRGGTKKMFSSSHYSRNKGAKVSRIDPRREEAAEKIILKIWEKCINFATKNPNGATVDEIVQPFSAYRFIALRQKYKGECYSKLYYTLQRITAKKRNGADQTEKSNLRQYGDGLCEHVNVTVAKKILVIADYYNYIGKGVAELPYFWQKLVELQKEANGMDLQSVTAANE